MSTNVSGLFIKHITNTKHTEILINHIINTIHTEILINHINKNKYTGISLIYLYSEWRRNSYCTYRNITNTRHTGILIILNIQKY